MDDYVSIWKVKKIRREEGLTITHSQKRICSTKSNHGEPVAEDVLNRQFLQHAPNRVWVSDITYIPTAEGWLYLAGIKDVFTKGIVGFLWHPTWTKGLCSQPCAVHMPHIDRQPDFFCTPTEEANIVAMCIKKRSINTK